MDVRHVFHKHRNCHRAYTAGDGSDVACFWLNCGKINVAAKFSVFISIDTNVDNNSTFFYHIGGYKTRFTHGGNENICL